MNLLIKEICDLANKAIQVRESDRSKFEKIIREINAIEDPSITKSDLVNGLVGDAGYPGNEWWIEEFIVHDIRHCEVPEETNRLLVFLLMAGSENAEILFKEAVVQKLSFFPSFLFYELCHGLVHDPNIPTEFIPVVAKVKRFKTKFFPEETPDFEENRLFVFNAETKLFEVNPYYHYFPGNDEPTDTFEDEFAGQEIDDIVKKYYGDYQEEEKIYRSCFDENQQPVLDRLKKVADISSKARHNLLRLGNKPIDAWFNNSFFHIPINNT